MGDVFCDQVIIQQSPMAYQIIFEPGRGQFREFEPRRVHTRKYSF